MFKQWIILALKININSHLIINIYQYAIAKINFVFLKKQKISQIFDHEHNL